jgi:hypothetical protein
MLLVSATVSKAEQYALIMNKAGGDHCFYISSGSGMAGDREWELRFA